MSRSWTAVNEVSYPRFERTAHLLPRPLVPSERPLLRTRPGLCHAAAVPAKAPRGCRASCDSVRDMRAHAVVLDVTHRLLRVGGAPFAVEVPAGERPLHALEVAAPGALGRALPFPLAQRVDGEDAWFAFVDDQLTAGERVPIATWAAQG